MAAEVSVDTAQQSPNAAEITGATLGYRDPITGRLWLLNALHPTEPQARGLSVTQRDGLGRTLSTVFARTGHYRGGTWHLVHARKRSYDPDTGSVTSQTYHDQLSPEGWSEPPEMMRAMSQPASEVSLAELKLLLARFAPEEYPQMRAHQLRLEQVQAQPLTCLVVMAIAIPFATGGVRRSPLIGVCRASGWFVLYLLFSGILALLAKQAYVPIAVAAWAPPVAALLLSLPLYRRYH
jgi:lipopolysaccharide export system permease protein